jgi:N-acetylmuramoyl-L-alanine amidase
VNVILDAGHGGRDVGTIHDGLWESSYVYDVMCRLKTLIETRSAASVYTTTKSKECAFEIPDQNVLKGQTDHAVLTTPRYLLDDPVVGVNLRWYLANSIFRRALKKGIDEEKVVFLSLHADSLHPSLRGAMAYIPGGRYVTGSFSKAEKVYLARAEVRESPTVSHSEKEALASEGLSHELADSIVDALETNHLAVHPYTPVRDYVVRDGREWVPAVIRYNKVPTRLLLEICNLGNEKDRALMKTKKFRQRIAESIYEGIVNFYDERDQPPRPSIVAAKAAK